MRPFDILRAGFLGSVLLTGCGAPPAPAAPVAAPVASAPPAAAPQTPLEPPLPLDARIQRGVLPNGLTYYVLAHRKPEKRAQLWLAVNAGSVLEDDDQRGLAHFVEHMGFNGTTRFPKQALVDFLEKSGVAFGADLNASTSFDQTVYTLQVPTDQPELVSRGISILRDWSDGVTFDPVEVDKERGVVLEEWRLGRGAQMRLFDKEAPVLFHGSKYADRITIGKPEIIKGAPRDAIVRFYKDWYRPDLMAVVAVGDFDTDEIEREIRNEFGSLKPAQSARPRPAVTLPPHADELVSIETDPEATSTTVSLVSEMPHRPEATKSDYRRMLAERLYATMLNARLDEIRRKPGAPFLFARSSTGGFVRTADAFSQIATVKETGAEEGLRAVLEEELRVERHGFTASELERAKADVLRTYEEMTKDYPTSDSRALASEIVRNYFQAESMPGPEKELTLARELLPTYTLEELNGLGAALSKGSRAIVVTGPSTMSKPTEAAILADAKEVAGRDIAAYADLAPTAPIMAEKPAPGAVVKTRTIPEIGVTEWTLANGARIVVKPTDFRNDEIRMSAYALGGTSLARDADFESAQYASSVVGQGGIGAFDAVALRKALSGKVASASAHIGETEEGIGGTAAPSDLETMLQMVHLLFTAPRRDDGAFQAWRARESESAKDRLLSPEMTFRDALLVASTQNHRRRQPTTPATIEKVDLDKAFSFYKERFADASGFTFFFVGNVDLDKTKGLVETYLGSLPATHRKETWRDVHVVPPRGVVKKEVAKGSEPKSYVSLAFHGDAKWSRDAENDIRALGEVLRIRLREVLREDMGGVYGVSAGGGIARRPKDEYGFLVGFGCAPENIDKLEKAVWDEIKAIQDHGVGDDYVAKAKELRRRAHELNLKDNGYWMRELESAYDYGDDPKLVLDFEAMLNKVSSDRIRAAAKKYLLNTQYVLGELRPATAAASIAPSGP
jgi:zinc protease